MAEYFRLQIKQKTWDGLVEHAISGWNIGPVPYGYVPVRVPHPVPVKSLLQPQVTIFATITTPGTVAAIINDAAPGDPAHAGAPGPDATTPASVPAPPDTAMYSLPQRPIAA